MSKFSVDQSLTKAKSHMKRGDIRAAENLCKEILARYPENQRAKTALLSIRAANSSSPSRELAPQIVEEFMSLYGRRDYEKILARANVVLPKYPKATPILNITGASLMWLGKPEEASKMFERITQIDPRDAAAFNNLGEAFRSQNKPEQAIEAYNKALELNPHYAEAYCNKSQALKYLGKLDEALTAVSRSIEIKPNYVLALKNLGYWLWQKGDLKEANAALQKAVDLGENSLSLMKDLSLLLEQLEEHEQSHKLLEKAISNEPKSIEILNRLATNLWQQGKLSEALGIFIKATEYDPDNAGTYNNLANFYKEQGQTDLALNTYERAITLKPELKEAHFNKGQALRTLGHFDDAIAAFDDAISIDPSYAEAYNAMGIAYSDNRMPWKAMEAYHKAIQLKPDFAEVYNNLGNTFKSLKKAEEALEYYNKAVAIQANYEVARTAKLHMEAQICAWESIEKQKDWLAQLGVKKDFVTPWVLLALEDNPARQQKRSELFARSFSPKVCTWLDRRPATKPDRLRIGYFSADFHNFPGMYLMAGLLEEHDRNNFEVIAFSYGPDSVDEMRKRIIKGVDEFIDIRGKPLEEVLQIARDKNIDIAIHRNGHTRHSRSEIFANRVAPVQINYLGYPGTLGADYIDYMIADEIVIPKEQRKHYNEKIIFLPHTYQPNDNKRKIAKTDTTRSDFGLPEQGVVFCCFNNTYKIGSNEFDIWTKVMRQVDESVLWLLGTEELTKDNLCRNAEARGINPERLIFADLIPQDEHLARHQHADLFLDTFYYNAHTTASDALWAGVPVVTKMGQQFSSRVCGSLLNAVGLPELITNTDEDYESLILKLVQAPDMLSGIKEKLHKNRLNCPLFDTKRYRGNFENGLLQAYDLYFQGQKPMDLKITE